MKSRLALYLEQMRLYKLRRVIIEDGSHLRRAFLFLTEKGEYARYPEYAAALQALSVREGERVLELGSGRSIFPVMLARRGAEVFATDYCPDELRAAQRVTARLALLVGLKQGSIEFSHADATRLDWPAEWFDKVSCISAIEHIPASGDMQAAAEIGRVVRPGGRAVITAPYGLEFREHERTWFVDYFERTYDDNAIVERIVEPSGLQLVALTYLGERIPGRWSYWQWTEQSGLLNKSARVLNPLAAYVLTTSLPPEKKHRAGAFCCTLAKSC